MTSPTPRWGCEAEQLTLLVSVTSESRDMEYLRMPRGAGAEGSEADGDRAGDSFRAASRGTPPCGGSGASSIMWEVGGAHAGLAVRL